jgi:general secretion pathway protein H
MGTAPISAIGTSTEPSRAVERGAQKGFSLLELLVVIAIIGIFVGAAVLSVGIAGTDRDGEREAARLKGVLDLVREEAIMQSRDFGVFFSRSAYRFYTYDYARQAWLAPANDRLLAEHALDERLDFTLVVEDRELVLDNEFDAEDDDDPEPQVLILSSGEMTPFEARIFRDANAAEHVLTAAVDGTIEISSRGAIQ